MKNPVLAFVLLLAPIACVPAHAASLPLGTQELRLEGTLDPATGDGDEVDLSVSYGSFFADNVQGGGRFSLLENDRVSSVGIGGYVEYNFDTGTELMPFLEGFAGFAHVDIEDGKDDTTGIVEGRAGVKFFLSEHVALAAAGVFAYASEKIYQDDRALDDTDAFVELSLRCYF